MDFYAKPEFKGDNQYLMQGDVLSPVPFTAFSVTEVKVMAPDTDWVTEDLTSVGALERGTLLASRVIMGNGIVLNQSCDLTGRSKTPKPLLVARILPASEAGVNDENAIQRIKELSKPGNAPTLFYLPAYNDNGFKLERSVVNLLDTACFPQKDITNIARACLRLRLTQDALSVFQERLRCCFGRFAAPDHLYFSVEEYRSIKR